MASRQERWERDRRQRRQEQVQADAQLRSALAAKRCLHCGKALPAGEQEDFCGDGCLDAWLRKQA